MPLLQAAERARRGAVDTKLRSLSQLFSDISRPQQNGRPPVPVNTKGAKTVLGIKEHQKQLREMQNMVKKRRSIVWNRPTDYYKRLIKQQDNIQCPQKPKTSPILQKFNRLKKNQQKSLSDAKIDREYEMLQQKYCPGFKLNSELSDNVEKKKFMQRKLSSKTGFVSSPLTYKVSSRKFKVKQKKGKTNKMYIHDSSSSRSITTIDKKESSGDTDKTLTPGQQSSTVTVTMVASEKKSALEKKTHLEKKTQFEQRIHCNQVKDCPSTSKYRLLIRKAVTPVTPRGRLKGGACVFHHLTSRNSNRSIPEVDCSLMDEIFYHETTYKAARTTSTYSLKNKHDYIKREIEQSIRMGKSADPLINNMLATAIERAQIEHIPWPVIKSIIENVQDYNNRKKVLHLLQIHQKPGIFILCTVHTCNFTKLILTLDKVMHHLKARFAPVLHHFTHCCVIEATIPRHYRKFDETTLRQYLDKDAAYLHAKKIDILDISKGEVNIKCLPNSMPNISRILSIKGYKILSSDYGFRPNREITLDNSALSNYRRLMNILLNTPDIETVADNVV